MRVERSSGQNTKVGWTTRGRLEIDRHVVHTRANWSLSDGPLEARNRVGVSFHDNLDAPILQVSHVAGQAFSPGDLACEVAEPDALYAAGYDEAASDEHEPLIIPGSMGELTAGEPA